MWLILQNSKVSCKAPSLSLFLGCVFFWFLVLPRCLLGIFKTLQTRRRCFFTPGIRLGFGFDGWSRPTSTNLKLQFFTGFLTQNNRGWLSTLEKRFFFWGLLGLLRFLSDVVGVPTFVTPIDYRSDFVDWFTEGRDDAQGGLVIMLILFTYTTLWYKLKTSKQPVYVHSQG